MITIPEVPQWLITAYQWILYLTPIWGLIVVLFYKPFKEVYKRFILEPDIDHEKRLDEIDSKINHIEDELERRLNVSRALLHHEIFKTAKDALNKGSITEYELENLEQLYIPYKEIGGNGTAEKLYQDCHNLKIKE